MGGALLLATVPRQPLKKEVSYIMLPFHSRSLPPFLPLSLPTFSLLPSPGFSLPLSNTSSCPPCAVPANLSAPVVAALSSSSISISWSAPQEPNGVIIIYTIFL